MFLLGKRCSLPFQNSDPGDHSKNETFLTLTSCHLSLQVDKMASLYNIHLRTGCFCNLGACQRHLGLSGEMVKKHFQVSTRPGRPHRLQSARLCGGWSLSLVEAVSSGPSCQAHSVDGLKRKGAEKIEKNLTLLALWQYVLPHYFESNF